MNFAQQSGRIRYDTDDVDDDETSDTYPKKSRKHAEVKPKLNRKKKANSEKAASLAKEPKWKPKGESHTSPRDPLSKLTTIRLSRIRSP